MKQLSKEKIFYVYSLRRPDKKMPEKFMPDAYFLIFYVGKGKGKRMYGHTSYTNDNSHKENIIKKIHRMGNKIIYEKLSIGLTEAEAFAEERRLIKFYGLEKDGGILANITYGGEGPTGHVHSTKTKRKISIGHMGKIISEETRKKLSIINTGRILSEEARYKIALARTGSITSEETKAKLSIAGIGNQRSLGCKASEETKKLLSEIHKKIFIEDMKAQGITEEMIEEERRKRKEKIKKSPKLKKEKVKKTYRYLTEEAKEYLSEIWKGVPKPEGTGAKISASKTKYKIEIDGKEYTLKELSILYNIDYSKLSYRYRKEIRGKEIITEDRIKRDLSDYLDRDDKGRLVSKKLKEVA